MFFCIYKSWVYQFVLVNMVNAMVRIRCPAFIYAKAIGCCTLYSCFTAFERQVFEEAAISQWQMPKPLVSAELSHFLKITVKRYFN